MILEGIKLENFQAHKRRVVKFSPGITTIKGATDKGKSAILRALGWACLNNMSGADFVHEGEKVATVTVKTDEEVIVRTRSKSGVNSYEMNGDQFKAFGTGVPDEIAAHLGLSELNFQSQHDAPFWFSETAGEVSRKLNAVIDLSIIDKSLSNVAGVVKKNEWKKTLCEERLEEVDIWLTTYFPQRKRIHQFRELEELEEIRDEHTKNFDRLETLLGTIRSINAKGLRIRHEEAAKCLELADATIKLANTLFGLRVLNDVAKSAMRNAKPPPSFSHVDELFDIKVEFRGDIADLEKAIRTLKEADDHAAHTKLFAAHAEKEFHKKTKGRSCPLCGNQIQ